MLRNGVFIVLVIAIFVFLIAMLDRTWPGERPDFVEGGAFVVTPFQYVGSLDSKIVPDLCASTFTFNGKLNCAGYNYESIFESGDNKDIEFAVVDLGGCVQLGIRVNEPFCYDAAPVRLSLRNILEETRHFTVHGLPSSHSPRASYVLIRDDYAEKWQKIEANGLLVYTDVTQAKRWEVEVRINWDMVSIGRGDPFDLAVYRCNHDDPTRRRYYRGIVRSGLSNAFVSVEEIEEQVSRENAVLHLQRWTREVVRMRDVLDDISSPSHGRLSDLDIRVLQRKFDDCFEIWDQIVYVEENWYMEFYWMSRELAATVRTLRHSLDSADVSELLSTAETFALRALSINSDHVPSQELLEYIRKVALD